MTKHGKMILDVVLHSHDHLNAEQIYLKIRSAGGSISLATVYNNLKTLVDQGALRKIVVDGCPDRYDQPADHQHMICARCGRLSDLPLEDLTELLEKQLGSPILSSDLRVNYLCEDCRRKLNSSEK